MDHQYIEEHNITDRYLLGRLRAEERSRFEEHFVDCQECLERLETTEDFRGALKTVAAEDATRRDAQDYAHAQMGLWSVRVDSLDVAVSRWVAMGSDRSDAVAGCIARGSLDERKRRIAAPVRTESTDLRTSGA